MLKFNIEKKSNKTKFIISGILALIISSVFFIYSSYVKEGKEMKIPDLIKTVYVNGDEVSLTIVKNYVENKDFDFIYFGNDKGINLIKTKQKLYDFYKKRDEIDRNKFINLSTLKDIVSYKNSIYFINDSNKAVELSGMNDNKISAIMKQIDRSLEQNQLQNFESIFLNGNIIRGISNFTHYSVKYQYANYYNLNEINQFIANNAEKSYIFRLKNGSTSIFKDEYFESTDPNIEYTLNSFLFHLLKTKYELNNGEGVVVLDKNNTDSIGITFTPNDLYYDSENNEIRLSLNEEQVNMGLKEPIGFIIEDKKIVLILRKESQLLKYNINYEDLEHKNSFDELKKAIIN